MLLAIAVSHLEAGNDSLRSILLVVSSGSLMFLGDMGRDIASYVSETVPPESRVDRARVRVELFNKHAVPYARFLFCAATVVTVGVFVAARATATPRSIPIVSFEPAISAETRLLGVDVTCPSRCDFTLTGHARVSPQRIHHDLPLNLSSVDQTGSIEQFHFSLPPEISAVRGEGVSVVATMRITYMDAQGQRVTRSISELLF